ncbi:MAG: ribosome biogenesis GTP-binding protein YihA/YsxC [Acetobacterales bacterium]
MSDNAPDAFAFRPEAPNEDQIEAGRLLFARPCVFVAGAPTVEGLPAPGLPEVAFAGRSNVGKSSLLNALAGRKALARASNTPGRTREINFFSLGERLMLVDLPGYGYAKAPKQMADRWGESIRLYLRGRAGLVRVCLLIDARHGVKESDEAVMRLMDESAVIYQLVLTKVDKAGTDAPTVIDATEKVAARHGAAYPRVAATSARSGAGIPELRAELAALAESV